MKLGCVEITIYNEEGEMVGKSVSLNWFEDVTDGQVALMIQAATNEIEKIEKRQYTLQEILDKHYKKRQKKMTAKDRIELAKSLNINNSEITKEEQLSEVKHE